MSRRVLVDTGPLVAMLSESDENHRLCVEALRHTTAALLTCWPVITEAAWLLRAYPEAVEKLLASFRENAFELAPLNEADLPGISAVLKKYKSLGLQLADASLVHIANREGLDTVFTLDRRDFNVVRLERGRKFRLIP